MPHAAAQFIDRRALSRGFDGSPPPLFGLGSHFHVQAQLGLEIGVTPARTERAPQTREPLAKAGHWLSGSLSLARKRRVQDRVTAIPSPWRFIRHANEVPLAPLDNQMKCDERLGSQSGVSYLAIRE